MRRIPWLLLPLTALLLCLSGCLFGSVEEMLAPPEPPDEYQSLQKMIARERGEAESIAPLGGENRQSVQLVDLDGDGRQEAVAFFRDEADKSPLKIAVFRQERDKEYRLLARIEGAGSDIQSVEYVDLTGDGCRELLVNWQASAAVRTLGAYTVADGQTEELLRDSCDRFFTGDLNDDGKKEVFLTRKGKEDQPTAVLCYRQVQDAMKKTTEAVLSQDAGEILHWEMGTLTGGEHAAFVTSRLGEDRQITDVLCLEKNSLVNCAVSEPGGQSSAKSPAFRLAVPTDMTGDGVTDVPVDMAVPGYGESEGRTFHWLSWRQYQADGTSGVVLRTCCGTQGQWYLELPSGWTGEFVQNVVQQRGGECLSIARKGEKSPFLTITCLTGGREASSGEEEPILLYKDSEVLYAARLFPKVWDCGMEEKQLTEGFHLCG